MKNHLLAMPIFLALGACGSGSEEPAAPATTEASALEPAAAPPANQIPAAIQGRWGMTAADCEPGRPDAKGLLTISATRLKFYESVGTLHDVEDVTSDKIRAGFGFMGEGQEWDREMTLELQEGGAALVRREYGEDAAPGSFRYTRCEQGGQG